MNFSNSQVLLISTLIKRNEQLLALLKQLICLSEVFRCCRKLRIFLIIIILYSFTAHTSIIHYYNTQRQYIFTHDAMLELMKVGDTEIPIQSLRRRYKELLAQDPNTESSRMETEFSVRHFTLWSSIVLFQVYVATCTMYIF